MGKLHLKETPEERERRKAEKARRKSQKRTAHLTFEGSYDKPKKKPRRQASEDSGWQDRTSSQGHSSQTYLKEIETELEERRFREKLQDAMMDDYDNRLDHIEAQFNDYAHIPRRWQSSGKVADLDSNDLIFMDDEEYAEWIREGMWRRTHKAEMEERDRRAAEAQARKDRERKAREETKRLEREAEAKRERKREMKELRRRQEAREYYDTRWQECTTVSNQQLRFGDIPWPVFAVVSTTATITEERISEFILHEVEKGNSKVRRERIREALLRWHPDKFEGKLGTKLVVKEKDIILEGVGIVARCLNNLMTGT